MKKNKTLFQFIFFVILIVCSFIYGHFNVYYKEFNGVVEQISYSQKGYPIVKINGKEYSLSFGRTDIQIVNIGDSLIKKRKDFYVEQYRKGEEISVYKWPTAFIKEEDYGFSY